MNRPALRAYLRLTLSALRDYRSPVTVKPVAGFGDPISRRRDSANTPAGAFFVPAESACTGIPVSLYGGSRGETFGSAGALLARFANPARSATQFLFGDSRWQLFSPRRSYTHD